MILTCPSNIAAKILPQLSDEEKAKLKNIKYQGIVCASVLMKKSLSNFYVTNITDETPFTGIIEMSALVDKKQFGGNALVYLPKYAAPDDKLFEKTDAEIEEIFISALEKMYPHFTGKDVLAFQNLARQECFPDSDFKLFGECSRCENFARKYFHRQFGADHERNFERQ